MLAVDRSQSMAGASLRNASAAARAFVSAKGPNDQIEVVTFGHQAVALTGFASSATDADAALGRLTADPHTGTALWDAVVRGAAALAHQGQPGRVIVVVTDGQDVSSSASFASAVAAAHRAHAAVYAIGIAGPGFTPGPLRELAARTGGLYREAATSSQLATLYSSISHTLAHTWQLRTGGRAFGEGDLGAATAALRAAVGHGPRVKTGTFSSTTDLAAYFVLASVLPLGFLVRRRNVL